MNNHPSISIDTPASRLVTVDSLYLRLMNDRVQDIYINTDHLATDMFCEHALPYQAEATDHE